MEIVYPADVSKIFIPKELDGSKGSLVIEVAIVILMHIFTGMWMMNS
ncbi:MAG: hypothetical protein HC830_13025 [Bacteroidetes bacterium]|nr:hypothetical protein [Bacteroidota bacterium]